MSQAVRTIRDLPTIRYPADIAYRRLPYMAAQARELGPIFKQDWPDDMYIIYLVGPEANKFVMQTHREYFSHDLGWTPNIGELLGKGLLNMDPPEHDRHRKLMNPAFTMAYMSRYIPVMNRIVAERTQDWAQRDEVDLFVEARKITFDVAAETLVGFQSGPEVDLLRELFYAMLNGQPQGISEESYWQQMVTVRGQLMARLSELIEQRRGIAPDDRSDILSMLVNARDDEGQGLSAEQILAHVNILLVAGHETTTTLSAWLLYWLATNPAALHTVQTELDQVVGANGELSLEAVRSLRQLGYAVQEAGRITPPVGMVPRGVLKDVEFNGYHLPAGTYVLLVIGAPHWDPAYFPQPERFDPQRFAPPREEDKRTPYALGTFGGGPRICIGVNFARIETTTMAAAILRSYTLTPVNPNEVRQAYYGLLGQPEQGIRVRVKKRD